MKRTTKTSISLLFLLACSLSLSAQQEETTSPENMDEIQGAEISTPKQENAEIAANPFLHGVEEGGLNFAGSMFFGQNVPQGSTVHYCGYGCNCTPTNTCTIGGTPQAGLVGFALATPITTGPAPMPVTACGAYFSTLDATSKGFSCAVYVPGIGNAPFCVTTGGVNATVIGWNENTNFTGCILAASTAYYIAYQVQGGGQAGNQDASAGVGFQPTAVYPTTFPNPESFSTGFTYSQYIR
jgi:hypothetical protein